MSAVLSIEKMHHQGRGRSQRGLKITRASLPNQSSKRKSRSTGKHAGSAVSVNAPRPGSVVARHFPHPDAIATLTLFVVTMWVWWPTLQFGFVYDDHLQIESNPDLRSWHSLGRLLTQPLWSQLGPDQASPYRRPLFSTLLLAQSMIFGPHPLLWHAVNLCLHMAVVLTLFWFLLLQFRRPLPAFCGSAVVALSPRMVETIAWISASSDLLCSLFILLSLCMLALARAAANPHRARTLRIACACFLMFAVLAKETAIVGVLLALAYELLFIRKGRRSWDPLAHAALFFPLAVFLFLHLSLHSPQSRSVARSLRAMPSIALFALGKLASPLPVSEFYDVWIDQTHSYIFFVITAVVLGLLVAAILWCSTRSRNLCFALLLALLPIVTCVSGTPFLRDYDLVHDRYLYLSMAGIGMMVAAAAAKCEGSQVRTRIALVTLAVVLGLEAQQSRSVVPQFSTDLALFSHAVEVAPRNILAYQLLAETRLRMHDCAGALAGYQRAQQLRPDLWKTNFFLGNGYLRCGMAMAAEGALRQAATVPEATREQAALAWYELGRAQLTDGNLQGARTSLIQAGQYDPGSNKIRNLLQSLPSSDNHP